VAAVAEVVVANAPTTSFIKAKSEVDRPNVPFVRPNLGYKAIF
jgi:hypothetical protein